MSELYSNELNTLFYTVTNRGLDTALDTFVAEIRVGNHKNDMGLYVELESDEESVGHYKYIVPNTLINGYRYAEVRITYTVEDHGMITDNLFFEITKRYISFSDINFVLGEEYELTWEQYDLAEKDVRMVIDSYCLQRFDHWVGSLTVRSTSGFIQMPKHLDKLDSVVFADQAGWDDPIPLSTANKYELTDAGYAIINDDLFKTIGLFDRRARTRKYIVTGTWGFTSVPTAVSQAAIALFKANLCDDKEYRNRYIDNLRNENIRIQYRDEAFSGDTTGNAFADDILAPYKILAIGLA